MKKTAIRIFAVGFLIAVFVLPVYADTITISANNSYVTITPISINSDTQPIQIDFNNDNQTSNTGFALYAPVANNFGTIIRDVNTSSYQNYNLGYGTGVYTFVLFDADKSSNAGDACGQTYWDCSNAGAVLKQYQISVGASILQSAALINSLQHNFIDLGIIIMLILSSIFFAVAALLGLGYGTKKIANKVFDVNSGKDALNFYSKANEIMRRNSKRNGGY